VTLERIETSCLCIRTTPTSIEIGPNETVTLEVSFDPSSDPDFTGALGVEISAYLAGGQLGFRTLVKVRVDPDDQWE